jgi:hypothetical protein
LAVEIQSRSSTEISKRLSSEFRMRRHTPHLRTKTPDPGSVSGSTLLTGAQPISCDPKESTEESAEETRPHSYLIKDATKQSSRPDRIANGENGCSCIVVDVASFRAELCNTPSSRHWSLPLCFMSLAFRLLWRSDAAGCLLRSFLCLDCRCSSKHTNS